MSTLNSQDRLSLCRFSLLDGRRCRTPRLSSHPHFCFYHARKEASTIAAEKLAHDLSFFFSADYLSACDLSAALARLIPAIIEGHIKPRTARTVAFLGQTLLQSIRLSQHEFVSASGPDRWRRSVHNSVIANHDRLSPPDESPVAEPAAAPEPGSISESARDSDPASASTSASQPASPSARTQPPPSALDPTPASPRLQSRRSPRRQSPPPTLNDCRGGACPAAATPTPPALPTSPQPATPPTASPCNAIPPRQTPPAPGPASAADTQSPASPAKPTLPPSAPPTIDPDPEPQPAPAAPCVAQTLIPAGRIQRRRALIPPHLNPFRNSAPSR